MEYKKDLLHEEKLNPLTAGMTGFIIGVLGTTAVALSDEDTRKKASKKAREVASELKMWGSKRLKKYEGEMSAVKEDVEEKLNDNNRFEA